MKHKILAIDDDPYYRDIYKFCLNEDYNLWVARDGNEGLRVFENTDGIELIVSELNLKPPGIHGYTVAHWVRRGSDIPLLFTTADHYDPGALFRINRVHVIDKPFDFTSFAHRISTIIDKEYFPRGR